MFRKLYSSTLHIIIIFTFLSVSFTQNPEWVNYTNGNTVNTLIEEGNYIWAGTGGGLVKIDKTSGETTFYNTANSGLHSNEIKSIVIDGNGKKWIGTPFGLVSFDGTNWTVYDESNSGLPDNRVVSIAIDSSGNKWIGTGGGLVSFDGTSWTVYNTSNSGLPYNWIWSLAIDSSGNKWVGTPGGLAVFNEGGVILGIDDDRKSNTLATDFILHQNYPNPFNPTTTIHYELPQKSIVQITIYNLFGRQVKTIVNKTQNAGYKSIIWNATNDQGQPVSAGMYFYRIGVYDPGGIGAGNFTQTKKMILLK